MSKTVGVILSGCGFMGGAEIQESVCTLLALDKAGAIIKCYAPLMCMPFPPISTRPRSRSATIDSASSMRKSFERARRVRSVAALTVCLLNGHSLPFSCNI